MTDNEKLIRRLYEITSNHEQGFAEQTRALLALGCARLGLEIGILSQIDINRYRVLHQVSPDAVPLEDDIQFNLPDTYCALTIAANAPLAYEYVGKSEISNHPAYAAFKLEAYIGIPIVVDGVIFGTLNFSSPIPRARMFAEIDIDALKIMAMWIEGELSRRRAQQKILQQAQELAATNARLEAMTKTDSLTQVGDRLGFFEKLQNYLQLSHRLRISMSVVMFDLDDFKNYNDSFGHVAGDRALVKVAKTIAELARSTDYVARYGGEEFIVLLPDTDYDEAVMTAERFREAIESIDCLQRSVSSSFGVNSYDPDIEPAADYDALSERLVDETDKALYHSKHLGKNRVTHFASLEAAAAKLA